MADAWLSDCEAAKQTAAETLQVIQVRRRRRRRKKPASSGGAACSSGAAWPHTHLPSPTTHPGAQERNLKFPEGGPEASRLTATARRKLGTLGSLLDSLRASLEGPEQAGM